MTARLLFDAAWVSLLLVLVWRLRGRLLPGVVRVGAPVVLLHLAGYYAIQRFVDAGVPADVSLGVAVLSLALVTGFDLSQAAPQHLRVDGHPGRFARRPWPHVVAMMLLIGAGLAMFEIHGSY